MNTSEILLNKAEQLVRTRGFDAMSFADLANAADIKKASVHYHFPTKADLAAKMIGRYRDDVQAHLNAVAESATKSADQARKFLKMYEDALLDGNAVCLCVAMSSARDSFDAATRSELAAFQEMATGWLKTLFITNDGTIEGVEDATQEAQALFALVEGAQLVARAHCDVSKFTQATALFVGRLRKE